MNHINPHEHARAAYFGHRKVMPRACVADGKKHLRTFLADILEDLGFITSECSSGQRFGRGAGRATAGPACPRRVRQWNRGWRNSRDARTEKLPRQGSRHRPTGLDYGKGRPTNWRGIRYLDAALLADALQRRDATRQPRDAAARRTGAEPGGGCGRGAEGRLARIVVSAKDRHPHPGSPWCGSAGADAPSRLGRGPAGLLHPR